MDWFGSAGVVRIRYWLPGDVRKVEGVGGGEEPGISRVRKGSPVCKLLNLGIGIGTAGLTVFII
jgi:hypothetical protein